MPDAIRDPNQSAQKFHRAPNQKRKSGQPDSAALCQHAVDIYHRTGFLLTGQQNIVYNPLSGILRG